MQRHSRDLAVAPSPARRPPLKAHGALAIPAVTRRRPSHRRGHLVGRAKFFAYCFGRRSSEQLRDGAAGLLLLLDRAFKHSLSPFQRNEPLPEFSDLLVYSTQLGQGLFARHVF